MRTTRTFSRWMPPLAVRRTPFVAWLYLGVMATAAVVAVVVEPLVCGVIVLAVAVAGFALNARSRHRLRRLAAGRTGEDIGTFARGFDRRTEPFDPWVVRATWDAIQSYVRFDGNTVPVRPGDRLMADLQLDEDCILVLMPEVGERAGRSLDGLAANPYIGRIETVGDFVRCLSHQPTASRVG